MLIMGVKKLFLILWNWLFLFFLCVGVWRTDLIVSSSYGAGAKMASVLSTTGKREPCVCVDLSIWLLGLLRIEGSFFLFFCVASSFLMVFCLIDLRKIGYPGLCVFSSSSLLSFQV